MPGAQKQLYEKAELPREEVCIRTVLICIASSVFIAILEFTHVKLSEVIEKQLLITEQWVLWLI